VKLNHVINYLIIYLSHAFNCSVTGDIRPRSKGDDLSCYGMILKVGKVNKLKLDTDY